MSNSSENSDLSFYHVLLSGIVFLFFFQMLSDFIASIYFLNLIKVELNENILTAFLLLTPIVLILFKKDLSNNIVMILGVSVIIFRVLQPIFEVQLKMIISGFGIGVFMIFLPLYFRTLNENEDKNDAISVGIGFGVALISLITLRTLGSTLDLSLTFGFQWIGWILAVIGLFALIKVFYKSNREGITINEETSLWKIIGLSVGLMSIFTLSYFAFTSPGVIASWTEGNYFGIILTLIISFCLITMIILLKKELLASLNSVILLIWNIIFVVLLVITISMHQIPFAFVSDYPLVAPSIGVIANIPLLLMLAFSSVIIIDFTLLTKELIRCNPNVRKLGISFFMAGGFTLLMIFSNVFTIAWDYIPIVGTLFRDMIWAVYMVIGVIIILSVFLIRKGSYVFNKLKTINMKKIASLALLIIIMASTTIIAVIVYEIPREQNDNDKTTLKILSYNIQQGVDESANENLEGQYQVIQEANADIIGLQESDTCRISSGNGDAVRYFNERLKIHSYFGPKTVTGTFGVALLSKYPIKNAITFYMTSEGEQTATIEAEITIKDKTYNVFVTHLGNYVNTSVGRSQIIQQEEILERIEGKENVILMGDFNFRPNTEQYEITVDVLQDSWEIAQDKAIHSVPASWEERLPNKRIDHIFVSSGTRVTESKYFGGSEADHPAVSIVLEA